MGTLDQGVEFAQNADPRCPCVLLLDISGSMSGEPIRSLNDGLQAFRADIQQDDLAQRRCEVAMVTFGSGGVQEHTFDPGISQPAVSADPKYFVIARDFQPPMLVAGGLTPMGEAIHRGIDLIQTRKAQYQQFGISYYRPWLFLITDGEPTDEWGDAAQRLHAYARSDGMVFFAVGVGSQVNMQILAQIALPERPPVQLQGLKFTDLFVWLSRSQQRVSASKVGEQVALPGIGWAVV